MTPVLLPARHPLVGYFVCDTQTEPEYDPPHDAPCLVCWQPLHAEDVRTISLMPADRGVASVFFRVHRTCAEGDPAAVLEIEHRILEGEFAALDEACSALFPAGCTCLSYGRGLTMTRVDSPSCPVHSTNGEQVMTTLLKHEIVLEYFAVHDDGAAVFRVPADDGQPTPNVEEYKLPDQLWGDMGSPSRISLTVQPGDTLNG